MRLMTIAAMVGTLTACSGGSGDNSPTPPPAVAPSANIAGSYVAIITVSSACSANVPSAARVLNSIADVTQTGVAIQMHLLAHGGSTATVAGTVSGKTISFSSFSLSENMTGGDIALVGAGTASVADDGSIAGTFSGTYQAASGTSCNAVDHHLEMHKL